MDEVVKVIAICGPLWRNTIFHVQSVVIVTYLGLHIADCHQNLLFWKFLAFVSKWKNLRSKQLFKLSTIKIRTVLPQIIAIIYCIYSICLEKHICALRPPFSISSLCHQILQTFRRWFGQ